MKKTTPVSSGEINVTIARLGEDNLKISLPKDSTVDDVVKESGIDVSSSEKLYVNSEEAEGHFLVDEGDHIAIIGKKDGGSEEDSEKEDKDDEDDESDKDDKDDKDDL